MQNINFLSALKLGREFKYLYSTKSKKGFGERFKLVKNLK